MSGEKLLCKIQRVDDSRLAGAVLSVYDEDLRAVAGKIAAGGARHLQLSVRHIFKIPKLGRHEPYNIIFHDEPLSFI